LFSLSLHLDAFAAFSAAEGHFFFSFFFSFFLFFFSSDPSSVCTAGTLAAVVTSDSLPELDSSDWGMERSACDVGVT
ncbi:hypothetical protein N326_05942, partial [Eurypyga helias]